MTPSRRICEFASKSVTLALHGGRDAKSGEFYEPEHTSRGPAKLTQLEPISLEADRAALWSASEAAIGEKWEL